MHTDTVIIEANKFSCLIAVYWAPNTEMNVQSELAILYILNATPRYPTVFCSLMCNHF